MTRNHKVTLSLTNHPATIKNAGSHSSYDLADIQLPGGAQMAREHLVAYASVLLVVSLFVVNCRPAFSQTITGDISGQVTDSTGAVLPNVTVTAVNSGTNFSRSATTNDAGNFRIPSLPIGPYTVTATSGGFKTAVLTTEVRAGAGCTGQF
jgi:hypothetical protein